MKTTLADARRVVSAQQATGRRAFVDMFSRFSPANQHLRRAMADQRYGPLTVLEIEGRSALLWEGYDLGLDTLALDMMHADFDLVTSLLGQPHTVHAVGTGGRGSAAEVVLGYPQAIARCASSSLMPKPYGMRGGWRATFTGTVLEYAMRAGATDQGPGTLTEYTAGGERLIELPAISPYAAMIDHVLACITGQAGNLIEPASVLTALELTLDVHQRLAQPAR
jgi:predicted dehydrogenase